MLAAHPAGSRVAKKCTIDLQSARYRSRGTEFKLSESEYVKYVLTDRPPYNETILLVSSQDWNT